MTSGAQTARLRRVPGLDGLRGFAVIAVMLYHFFRPIFPGGFLGVDVFFVLSGFLITSLLIRERATTGTISLKNFWIRRVRRILPAAFTVMFVISAITLAIGGDSQVGMGWQMLSILTFSNNWVQVAQSHSYFADSVPEVFSHYWSLAVEEQFYVVWPLLFVLFSLLGARRKQWMGITLGLVAVSATLMGVFFVPGVDPTRVYYGTDTHAFGLLLGAFIAFWMSSSSASPIADSWPKHQTHTTYRRVVSVFSTIAFAVVVTLCFTLPDQATVTYRGGIVLASVLTSVVLFAVVQEVGAVHYICRIRALRWLGERSYSLYLWHWPLIVIISEPFRLHGVKNSPIAGTIALVLTVLLSIVSYRYIETPFRKKGIKRTFGDYFSVIRSAHGFRRWRRVTLTACSLVVIGAAIAAGVTAPTESQMQRNLQALRSQGAKMRPGLAQLFFPKDIEQEERVMPTGKEITALGDSVMLASSSGLQHTFPGIYVDADVSRSWPWAEQQISAMEEAHTLDRFVVLGLGTNGVASPGEINKIIRKLGPNRVIILVSPYGDRPWMEQSRRQILAAVKTHKNVYLADWYSAVEKNLSVVSADGIHPGEEGGKLYAKAVKQALRRWVNRGPRW